MPIVTLMVGLWWVSALSAQPVEIVRFAQGGNETLQAKTSLLRYEFAQSGGALRSAYVHFTGYQLPALEAVPGWEGGAKPTLALGVSLPFEVWLGETSADPFGYKMSAESATPKATTVRLTHAEGDVFIEKAFSMESDALYTMGVELRVRAPGQRVRIVVGHRPTGKDAPELRFLYDGKAYQAPLAPGSYGRFEGLGLVSKDKVYFLGLAEGGGAPFLASNAAGQPVFGLEGRGEIFLRGTLYTGRNRYILLEKANLHPLAEVGVFSRFLVWTMKFFEWLYRLTGNYGWAIILFTLITRIVVYPLMRNQYRSMAKMQRLAPKLKKLQERYKDDRQTLQQQMMELYRQEKVNPLGGCVPLLLQFPLLILLWQAIMYSAEQIHVSPGFLWIRDLSQPDPYYILIVLATAAQLLQQWLTQRRMPEPPTGGTQVLGWVFPLVMAVLFLSFPAGLWLYWLLATVLQIGQQLIFDWEIAREGAMAPRASDGPESS